MNIAGYEFPDDLYYDKNHAWARLEGNVVTQGFTQFAQKLAKEIQYVEIAKTGRAVTQGQAVMSIESGKWVGRVLAMVGGKVIAVNEELEFSPTLINESPYEQGWLIRIEASNLDELKTLWRANDPALAELINGDVAKYKLA
ncbi:MAG: glycine cleavage system protein GcvH [Chloroflexi bacterium]|nr:glycine cleavage system protein GcvH [Chloroflexota bacterium]